jgi:enamine deaminase RidA (YjgF/YER057c/UK114 family)
MDVYHRLKELQIELPSLPPKGGVYSQVREFGADLCYLSGYGTDLNGIQNYHGKLGREYCVAQGQQAAVNCMLNILAVLHHELGDLNRIRRFVKMLAFVASTDDFYSQPAVANGASQLLVAIFGEEVGLPARSAIGVNVLPGNIPVEIELLVELKS